MSDDRILVINESLAQSLGRDIGSFATIAGLIGLGAYIGSSAMEWAGFLIAALIICGRSQKLGKGLSPQAAADWLASEYGVTGAPRSGTETEEALSQGRHE